MDSFHRIICCWLTCISIGSLGCQRSDPANGLPKELSIQLVEPSCRKNPSGRPFIIAHVRNNSPYTVLRIDIELALAEASQKQPVARHGRSISFSPGVNQKESRAIDVPIDDSSVAEQIERVDLQLFIRPMQIHVADSQGKVHVADLSGSATLVVRDWVLSPADLDSKKEFEVPKEFAR